MPKLSYSWRAQGPLPQTLRCARRDPQARGGGGLKPGHSVPAAAAYWSAGGGGTILPGESPGLPCYCAHAGGGPRRGVLGILDSGAEVRLGYRRPAGQLTAGQENKVGGRGRGGRAWGKGRRCGPPAAGTEAAPISIPQAASLPPSTGGLTFPAASQWAGPAAGSGLPCSLRAARLRPRRRWHGDSSQVCKLVPLSPGQGSHGDWLI